MPSDVDSWPNRMLARVRRTDPRRVIDGALGWLGAGTFVLATALPLAGIAVLPASFQPAIENRLPAPPPSLVMAKLEEFPRAFEQWFGDRFAFRQELIRAATLGKLRLGVSPSKKVMVGKDGWLFYRGENALPQFRRQLPFGSEELSAWTATLEARRAWLAERGIAYLVVLPPNKETVYPDLMPDELTRERRSSRLDQLLEHLEDHSGVETLDLRTALDTARRRERVYAVTDTHWNDAGAFVASQAITGRLHERFPGVVPLSRDATTTTRLSTPGGDLSGLMAVTDDVREPGHVVVTVARPRSRPVDPGVAIAPRTAPHELPLAREVDDPSLPSALVFKDSFMNQVAPFLSESLRRSVYLAGHDFDRVSIRREHPDVVIEEFLERYLMLGAPSNPPDLEDPNAAENALLSPPGMDAARAAGRELASRGEWSTIDLADGGGGSLLSDGPDPSITMATPGLAASPDRVIWVTVRALPGEERQRGIHLAQLFFSANGAGFSEPSSVRFPILIDELAHAYRVMPSLSRSFRGSIDHLRLDFPDREPGVRYWVTSITASE